MHISKCTCIFFFMYIAEVNIYLYQKLQTCSKKHNSDNFNKIEFSKNNVRHSIVPHLLMFE